MKKTEYAKYLQSEHWRTLRKEYIADYPYCERCKLPRWLARIAYDQDLNVHHRSYANLGNEDWMDLESLCSHCHEIETFGRTDLAPVKTARCEMCGELHWNPYAALCRTCERVSDPPSLYELLSLGTTEKPLILDALSAICCLLAGHGVNAEGLGRFINAEFKKIAERQTRSEDAEIPF